MTHKNELKFCLKCGGKLVRAQVAGRERLGCAERGCGYVFWDNPTPTVAAVVETEGRVVLVRQRGWPEKWYGIVSGFLERGETPEEGILREVQEELGMKREIVRFIGTYSFFQLNQLILAYHVRAEGEIQLGEELEAYKLIAPERLRPWEMGTGPAVRDWLESRQGQD